MKKILLILTAIVCVANTYAQNNFSGTWIDSYESTKLVLKQNGNTVSGTIYTTSHGCEWDYPECAERVTGTVTNGVATITYYSAYQGKKLSAKLKLISNTKMEWIPQTVGNKFYLFKK